MDLQHLEWAIDLSERIGLNKVTCSPEKFKGWAREEFMSAGEKFLSFNDEQKLDIFIYMLGKIG